MPNNKRHTIKQMQGKGKDKMHPSSRKGHQMERILLRSDKLKQATRRQYNAKELKSESRYVRWIRHVIGADRFNARPPLFAVERPLFFIYSMTSPDPLTLDQLKSLIQDKFIGRNDDSIKELESKRRPGRPKDAKLVSAELAKEIEMSEYKSGFGESQSSKQLRICRQHVDQETRR
jgi:translation machinery-associated protein 16